MEFELQQIESVTSSDRRPTQKTTGDFDFNSTTATSVSSSQNSMVLDELSKQIEDLQDKLKLNYRKLLLYETENQKLIQEKNRLFFEAKSSAEQSQAFAEKLEKLEAYSSSIEENQIITSEKLLAYEKLNQTQTVDLKRLSKFHLKIKNIIKPYVETLKTQLTQAQSDLIKLKQQNEHSNLYIQNQNENIASLKSDADRLKKNYESEKSSLVRSYEEQVHFLSKEVVDHQQKVYTIEIENLRLKKATETKHFIENELIKFKRIHETDQKTIADLKMKLHELTHQFHSVESEHSNLKHKLTQSETDLSTQTAILDNTRAQLVKKIDENENLHLRLKMFEKLNTNLTLSFKDSSLEAPQTEL